MIDNPQLKPYGLKPQTFKHVEIINVSDKPTYDTSLEGLELELAEFEHKHDRAPSVESVPTQTSKLKLVETTKIQNITRFDTSSERS